jgi:hypothetical protein
MWFHRVIWPKVDIAHIAIVEVGYPVFLQHRFALERPLAPQPLQAAAAAARKGERGAGEAESRREIDSD